MFLAKLVMVSQDTFCKKKLKGMWYHKSIFTYKQKISHQEQSSHAFSISVYSYLIELTQEIWNVFFGEQIPFTLSAIGIFVWQILHLL